MPADNGNSQYKDPAHPIATRIDDLLGRMTLDEKIGQLVGTWAGQLRRPKSLADVESEVINHHIGGVSSFGWSGAIESRVEQIVKTVNHLQEVARSRTRLGIPLLFSVDAIHGHAYVAEGTVFPNGLGMAATWNPGLVEDAAAITATEVRATGAHQNYSPTCDVARDPRWGRTFETFGESPFLCGTFAAAKVRGYQGEGLDNPDTIAATAKHFPAYSEPVRGEDAAPVEVSEYLLRNVFLPPFIDAIEAGVTSVMPCYNAIDGEPVHGSSRYLTSLLRDELGFDGTVVSDWNGVRMLDEDHRVAEDHRHAVRMTREAGLDIASVDGINHVGHLKSSVEDGDLDEEVLDASVERVLALKFRLGLFEDPFVDTANLESAIGTAEHRYHALRMARQSMTLLKNDDLLPLAADADVLVAGPNADDPINQLGGWSVADPADAETVTIRDGIEAICDGTVTFHQGADITAPRDIDAAANAAEDADVAVVAVGENWYIHEFGPATRSGTETGEFPTRHSLSLPDAQHDLLESIHATGTPLVGVLVTGRPLAVDWMADNVPAILMAYYPGSLGGRAVAETLFGKNDPSGRLPISIPRSMGHLPTRFNYLPHPTPIGAAEHEPSYDPLFPFGHGLSYTTYEYGEVELSDVTVEPDESISVSVTIENTGNRRGIEVVQVYVTDLASSRVTPVRELRGFDRITLAAGESRAVSVPINAASLGRVQADGTRRTEPGKYLIEVAGQTTEFRILRR